jgi:hypothetical protein
MKNNLSKVLFLIILYLFNFGCQTQIERGLNKNIIKYTRNNIFDFNVFDDLENVKVTSCRIRNGKQLFMTVENKQNSTFVIADLKSKIIEKKISNRLGENYEVLWDVSRDKLIATTILNPYEITTIDLLTGGVAKKNFKSDRILYSTDIIINGSQLFFLKGVTGVGFLNFPKNESHIFNNPGIQTTNYNSSTISLPISNSLNLISGHTIADRIIQLYAIDSRDSIKWKYQIELGFQNGEPVSILHFNNSFLAKYDSTLFSLDELTGKVLWSKKLGIPISMIYKYEDKILTYSCYTNQSKGNASYSSSECEIVFKLFDCKSAKEIWNNMFLANGIPHVGICGSHLLVSDNQSFRAIALDKGLEVEKKYFPKGEKSNYAFEMIMDEVNGEYYLKSFQNVVYW